MYENKVYIKNYAAIKKYPGDIGVPELLNVEDKQLLGL